MITFYADKNQKLSKAVMRDCENISYSAFRKLLRNKDVKVNGVRVKDDVLLKVRDFVEIYYEPEKRKKYDVVYSDGNIIVVNKKSGYSSESVFRDLCEEYGKVKFIHRLDRNTSGIMVFATNEFSETELLKGFKERTFDKFYSARVLGVPEKKEDVMTAYLIKDADSGTVKVSKVPKKGSVRIVTGYKVVSDDGKTAELKVRLFTGKTHQIRAHLAFIGHPIVGDGKYGDNAFNNEIGAKSQMLCATEIVFHFGKDSRLYYLDGKSFKVDN
ncbi:MAG: RluA family pseudouridine synthase [Clostridia bacterium]|nr:RluA family pseudouridine synthase [Clostridia bacterium]